MSKIQKNIATNNKANRHNAIYKNSSIVHINPEFKNPKTLRWWAGVDLEYIAKLEKDRKQEEKLAKQQKRSNIRTSMNDDIISDIFGTDEKNKESEILTRESLSEDKSNIEEDKSENKEEELAIANNLVKNDLTQDIKTSHNDTAERKAVRTSETENDMDNDLWLEEESKVFDDKISDHTTTLTQDTPEKIVVYYELKKHNFDKHNLNLSKWIKEVSISGNMIDNSLMENKWENESENKPWKIEDQVIINNQTDKEDEEFEIDRYNFDKHSMSLKKGISIRHDFEVDNTSSEQAENKLSDSMMENLLKNEEIDIETLESENDEFLQKVFNQTMDKDVMNLIVENYLNEYQFVKAKKFIDNLPEAYVEDLKPSLHLRVIFNSFSLSSKNVNESLSSVIQDYSSKNKISEEDTNRYLSVLALMNQNYDHFFEISAKFTSEKYKAFSSKLLWYKDQISKQMWMPQYYFDTLVSLELFNQWLFQPAKVLALYSLQKNSNYILPYQILAYANFLTNSWDTSIEYLKKLTELDSNNAEKYRFLMWVAYYRNEKYGQSAIMLSMIRSESLRLDSERYLIRDYLYLNQLNKLISSWDKLLWYENLVASDFYTYFYEAFFHPYAEWQKFQIYTQNTELANKMIRVCSIKLLDEEKVVCMYGSIWKNIAIWNFEWIEKSLLKLVEEYPQWYLYHALWEYYIKQWDLEKAKAYLLKAVSSTQKASEKNQIKKLLEDTM